MRRIAAATVLCLLPLASAIAEQSDFNQLPVLPVSAIQAADAAARKIAPPVASKPAPAPVFEAEDTKRQLTVTPGVNEIITVSVGHTNRIVMPFETPRIRTTSNAGFEVEGRSVYLTSNDEGRPITTFINDANNPDLSLSLTFVPKRMPPVQITLELDGESQQMAYRPSRQAKAWEESQPYVGTIRDVLREIAIGKTPQGYSITNQPNQRQTYRGCIQSGLEFDFDKGQVLEGHSLRVNVGVVENKTNQMIEFREPSCAGTDVRAVSAWPNPLLKPGQKSEIYVVRSVPQPEKVPHNARRSLLEE